jgi:hypothetical protein
MFCLKIYIFEVLINVLCLLTKYKSYFGHRIYSVLVHAHCLYVSLLNEVGLEEGLYV